ncbi:LZTR1, partial [Symbiodinium sp. CCMP2456]
MQEVSSSLCNQVPQAGVQEVASSVCNQVPQAGVQEVSSSLCNQVPRAGVQEVASSVCNQVPQAGVQEVSSSSCNQVPQAGVQETCGVDHGEGLGVGSQFVSVELQSEGVPQLSSLSSLQMGYSRNLLDSKGVELDVGRPRKTTVCEEFPSCCPRSVAWKCVSLEIWRLKKVLDEGGELRAGTEVFDDDLEEGVSWPIIANVSDSLDYIARQHREVQNILQTAEEVDNQVDVGCDGVYWEMLKALEHEGRELHEVENHLLDSANSVVLRSLTVVEDLETHRSEDDGQLEQRSSPEDGVEDPPPLQSKIVGQDQVRREPGKWKPALLEEYISLVQKTQAVEEISDDQYWDLMKREDTAIELIPAKGVYVHKSSGRRKARVVGCGNYCSGGTEVRRADLYASGAGSEALRMVIRRVAMESNWCIGTVDVRTAFLQAPLLESRRDGKPPITIVKVPSILRDTGITQYRYWLVKKALYGLASAPKSWSDHRDRVLMDMKIPCEGGLLRLVKMPEDVNLWQVVMHPGKDNFASAGDQSSSIPGKKVGVMALYVDDILVGAPRVIADALIAGLQKVWELSPPEWLCEPGDYLKYAGFELEKTSQGIRLHQESYVKDLLEQQAEDVPGEEKTPAVKVYSWEEPETDTERQLLTKRAQALIGQLLWLSGRTRPDLAYGVSMAAQKIASSPAEAVARAEHLVRYLRSSSGVSLHYKTAVGGCGRWNQLRHQQTPLTLEVYTDASFAADEQCRSFGSVQLFWGGSLVMWSAARQTLIAAHTAESELYSLAEGHLMGKALRPTVAALMDVEEQDITGRLYCDNSAAVQLCTLEAGSWRTRHLRLRGAIIRQDLVDEIWSLAHLDGVYMPADLGTKPVGPARLEDLIKLCDLMNPYICESDEAPRASVAAMNVKPSGLAHMLLALLLLAQVSGPRTPPPETLTQSQLVQTATDDAEDMRGTTGEAEMEVDDVECSKSAINQWSVVKPFGGCQPPKQRSLHASIVVGDCLYIFGGYDGSSRVNDFYKFSFKASKWSQIHPAGSSPTARDRHVVVSYADKIYIFAGYDGNNRVNDFWQYDTEHEVWSTVDPALGNPPTPRHSHSGVEYDGSMYIFAGYDGNYRSDFHRYNFPQRKWSIVPVKGSVPKARYRTSAVAYKNRMLVVGGHDGAKHLNDFYQLLGDTLQVQLRYARAVVLRGPRPLPCALRFNPRPKRHLSLVLTRIHLEEQRNSLMPQAWPSAEVDFDSLETAGVAEGLLACQRFHGDVAAVHGSSGGALVAALFLCGREALTKTKAYLNSGKLFRNIGLADVWDPARLIPRAVEESGALPEDAHARLSGKLHVQCTRGGMMTSAEPVTYSTFASNSELLSILQASSSFAFGGVDIDGEPHWDGGITEVLPVSADFPTITVAPVSAKAVDICPDAGFWVLPCALGARGWRLGAQSACAAWDCTFMFSSARMMKYWAAGEADAQAFLQRSGYAEPLELPVRPWPPVFACASDGNGSSDTSFDTIGYTFPPVLFSVAWAMTRLSKRSQDWCKGWSMVETTGQVPPPSPRDSHSAVICGDSMYLFGGSTGSARNDLYAFSFETDQWTEVRTTPGATQKSNVPCPRFCHTCDVYNNSLYVFGGYDGQQRLNDFWQFKLATEVNIDIPSSSLVSDLREFLNDAKLSDVTFIVEGKPVYAHKLLCMRCSYFRAMFEGQMREAQQKTITINNVSHRVFLALLEYLYTDEFEISMDIAMDLFVAADQFGIDRLKRLCEKKILVSINIDSAATILQ